MHGRVWIVPLFLIFWSGQVLLEHEHWAIAVQAVTDSDSLSREPSPKSGLKKRSPASKKPRAKARVTPTQKTSPRPPSRTDPHIRRYAAQNSTLRRLAAAGLLRGPIVGESRVLESWRIRPVDGDTFWYGTERIRIRGYDAPEMSQPQGFDAALRLEGLLREGEVRMYPHGLDVYGRTLADVYVEQRNVAEVMIAEGFTKRR